MQTGIRHSIKAKHKKKKNHDIICQIHLPIANTSREEDYAMPFITTHRTEFQKHKRRRNRKTTDASTCNLTRSSDIKQHQNCTMYGIKC